MTELFNTLGLNAALLISQIVNFALLLILLQKFAYKPVLKMLNERAAKIETSLQQAEQIQQELQNTEATKIAEISKAKQEAQDIITAAHQLAAQNTEKTLQETQKKTQAIVAKAKEEIQQEKEDSVREAKQEITEIAILIAEKILKKQLDQTTEKHIADEVLAKIK